MKNTCIIIGSVTEDQRLKIDKPIPLPPGKVQVVIEQIPESKSVSQSIWNLINKMEPRRTKESIDSQVEVIREEWGRY